MTFCCRIAAKQLLTHLPSATTTFNSSLLAGFRQCIMSADMAEPRLFATCVIIPTLPRLVDDRHTVNHVASVITDVDAMMLVAGGHVADASQSS